MVGEVTISTFTEMRVFVLSALTVLLFGCASAPNPPKPPNMSEMNPLLTEAAARAKAKGDFRPYPDGWPNGYLPFHPEPTIVLSIKLGQTMSEVTRIIGREGWSHTLNRSDFLNTIHRYYEQSSSLYKLPSGVVGMEELLPAQGRYIQWEYQGFPSTGDWIELFFSPSNDSHNSDPRVVARGVFRLGDF